MPYSHPALRDHMPQKTGRTLFRGVRLTPTEEKEIHLAIPGPLLYHSNPKSTMASPPSPFYLSIFTSFNARLCRCALTTF